MSRETTFGGHKIWFDDDKDLVRLKIVGTYSVADYQETAKFYTEAFEGKTSGRFVIIDLSEASPMPKETRMAMRDDSSGSIGLSDRTAMIGASPGIRMIGKIIMKLSGVKDSAFFKTEDQALSWLKS